MATAALVSVEEYLASSYHPDRDYLDGELQEREMGELDHSVLQCAIIEYFAPRRRQLKLQVLPEIRVQVARSRFRVPDICVVRGSRPATQILTTPPFLCIEILSPGDTLESMQARIDDYLTMGVPCVWLLNPRNRRAWVHTTEGSREAKDGILHTTEPDLAVPLSELFEET